MNRSLKRLVFVLLAAALPALLSSCYLPDRFVSELRISRVGGYAFSYQGVLTYAPLYRDVAQGRLTAEEADAKAALYNRDLARDSGFKEIEWLGKGQFRVDYERQGILDASQLVTFVRRNARIIEIRAHDDGLVLVKAHAMSATDAQQAVEMGLQVRGKFHVVTDAAVVEHNAQDVREYQGYQVYVWDIASAFSPAPRLILVRDVPVL